MQVVLVYLQPFRRNSLLKCVLQSKIVKNSPNPLILGVHPTQKIPWNTIQKVTWYFGAVLFYHGTMYHVILWYTMVNCTMCVRFGVRHRHAYVFVIYISLISNVSVQTFKRQLKTYIFAKY